MLKFLTRKNRPGKLVLPDDVELLAYLDGQLSPERRAEIEKLQTGSWEVRLGLAELARDIETYTEATSHLAPGHVPPFEDFWKGASVEAARLHGTQRERSSSLSRQVPQRNPTRLPGGFRGLLQWRLPSAGLAVTAAILVVALLVRISSTPTVSAKELLQRSMLAEDRKIRQVSAPVVYQKLTVRRTSAVSAREETATWEVWNDPGKRRFTQRVEGARGSHAVALRPAASVPHGSEALSQRETSNAALTSASESTKMSLKAPAMPLVLAELEAVFQVNQMDPARPLSVAAFEAWHGRVGGQTAEVTQGKAPDGAAAFVIAATALKGSSASNSILKNELIVRAEDWHPVEQRLKVQGTNGIQTYQVTESAFQVLSLSTLDASIFADFLPPPPTIVSVKAPAATPEEPSTLGRLSSVEVAVHYALHQAKACLGESIDVVSTPSGKVEVRGLVTSAERKKALLTALREIPLANLNIETIEEATRTDSFASQRTAHEGPDASSGPPVESTITVRPHRLPIQDQLKRHFASHANANVKIAELSTEAVSLSRAALSDAWALRNLAEEFGPIRTSNLGLQSKWLVEVMIRDHVRSLRVHLSRSQSLLEPVLHSFANETTAPSEPPASSGSPSLRDTPWTVQTMRIFTNIEQIDHLSNGLFAGAELPTDDAEQAARQLLSSLAAVINSFGNLERKIGSDFSGNPSQLSLQDRQER